MTDSYGRRGYYEPEREKRSLPHRLNDSSSASKRYRRGYDGVDRRSGRSENRSEMPEHRSSRENDFYSDDWKCLECMTWNYPADDCCHRCGAYIPQDGPYSPSTDETVEKDQNEEVDEFGRDMSKKKETKKAPEWPPKFESNGTAFVFDSRSGMFYHTESDFFYDPKSKLYFSNKKRIYYRYDEASDPIFVQVQIVEGQDNVNPTAEPALAPLPKLTAKTDLKNGISIKLKTKTLKSKKAKGGTKKEETANQMSTDKRLQKQHAVDIDKWSDRQAEKRVEQRQIQRTAKGEPMCSLCRRKFATVEKLLYHERVSKLHKENLTKQQRQKETSPSSESQNYVDRAKQRRDMYGPETSLAATVALPPKPVSQEATPQTVVPTPQENLSESNIGNQLLQKMGWKEGKSLGRQGRPEGSSNTDLVNDWERIEALAANGGKRRFGSRNGGLGSQR